MRGVPLTASRALARQTERWFVRHGAPTLIADYGFARHVLPRMLPFLAFTCVASLAWLVPADSPARPAVLAGVGVVGVAAWAGLTAFGRRLPRFSRGATVAVLSAYAMMPLIVPVLIDALHGLELRRAALFPAAFAALFGGAFVITTYGLVPLTRRAIGHAASDMRNSLTLQGRALPLLLFVTLFFFFTGELWQAMDGLSWWRVSAVLLLFAAVTVLAAAGRLGEETRRVEADLSPPRLATACQRTPLSGLPFDELAPGGVLAPPPLAPQERASLLLVLATRQLVQAAVVGLGLFVFLLLMGALIVTDEVAEQWIGGPPHYAAWVPFAPVALLLNAALLAGFGSMYFAVTSMTDAEHRQRFFAPIVDDVERTLAVRAVYLEVVAVVGGRRPPPGDEVTGKG